MTVPHPSLMRRLRQEIAAIVVVALGVTTAMTALRLWLGTWREPVTVVFNSLPFALVVSATIAASATVLLILTSRVVQRLPAMLRWTVWIAIFIAAAVVGTLLAPAILSVSGVLPRELGSSPFGRTFAARFP
jgi:hypothetical protein